MTLAKKIETLLKDELKPKNIKTVIDIAKNISKIIGPIRVL